MTTMIYTGAGNTANWSDPADWKGGVVPGMADTALLTSGSSSTITAAVSLNNIMILSPQTLTFDSTVTTYGLGNCKGLMVCAGATAIFAPGSSLADGGVLQVGVKAVGTLTAVGTSGHATLLHAERTELGKDSAGVGTMTIDGASLSMIDGLTVGEAGHGKLNVLDGGKVMASHFVVGLDAGASGTVTLSSGAVLSVSGGASIGNEIGGVVGGTGAVSVATGATLHAVESLRVVSGSSVSLSGGAVTVGDTTGSLDVMAGGAMSGYGTLTTRSAGTFHVDGTLEAKGGTLDVQGSVSGTGTVAIDSGCTIKIDGKTVAGTTIAFLGSTAALSLAKGAMVTGELTGFGQGDTISMAGVASASWSSVTDLLTLKSATGQTVDRLHLGGSYAQNFVVTQQGGLGVVTLHS